MAIELGDFQLNNPALVDLAWFMGGMFVLTGLTAAVIIYYQQGRPDPFVDGERKIEQDEVDVTDDSGESEEKPPNPFV